MIDPTLVQLAKAHLDFAQSGDVEKTQECPIKV